MVYHNLYPRIEYCCIFQIWQVPVGYEELAVAERKRGVGGDWSQSEKAKKLRMNNNDNDE